MKNEDYTKANNICELMNRYRDANARLARLEMVDPEIVIDGELIEGELKRVLVDKYQRWCKITIRTIDAMITQELI